MLCTYQQITSVCFLGHSTTRGFFILYAFNPLNAYKYRTGYISLDIWLQTNEVKISMHMNGKYLVALSYVNKPVVYLIKVSSGNYESNSCMTSLRRPGIPVLSYEYIYTCSIFFCQAHRARSGSPKCARWTGLPRITWSGFNYFVHIHMYTLDRLILVYNFEPCFPVNANLLF